MEATRLQQDGPEPVCAQQQPAQSAAAAGHSADVSSENLGTSGFSCELREPFDLLLSAIDEGVAEWNILTDEYRYSDRYCQLLSYKPGELARGYHAWIAQVHAEDRNEVVEKLRAHLETRAPYDVECRVREKSGSYRWFRVRGQAAYGDGRVAMRMVKTLRDIDERKQLELEAERNRNRLQELTARLLELQEAERTQIARELHDEIAQVLTAIKLNLQGVGRGIGNPLLVARLSESTEMIDELSSHVRNLSRLIRPPQLDALGLRSALAWHVENRLRNAGVVAHLICDPLLVRLRPDLETACFRIVQEALTNVVRHAAATDVSVEVRRYDNSVQVNIRDNGIGFDLVAVRERAARGECLGLFGMEERARLLGGHVTIRSVLQGGTDVHAWFPLLLAVPRSRAKQRKSI